MRKIVLASVLAFTMQFFAGSPTCGRTVDLISLVDLDRDVVAGTWLLENGQLSFDNTPSARLCFPYRPPAEYDYIVEFTLSSGQDPYGNIAQILSHGDVAFAWSTNAGQAHCCRLEDINGHSVIGNPTLHYYPFSAGQRYTSTVRVRNDRVVCEINGEVLVQYRTDFSDLSLHPQWTLPQTYNLGIGGWGGPTVIHSATVVELGVVEPSLRVTSPNGGEMIAPDSAHIILWESTAAVNNVVLEYTTTNGMQWIPIGTVPNTGSSTWIVPNTVSEQCLVRITDVDHPLVTDTSDAVFSIYGYVWYTNPANGHRYALTLNHSNWEDAEAEALSVGGHLVSVNDQEELNWLLDTNANPFGLQYKQGYPGNPNHNQVWIGLKHVDGDKSLSSSWAWQSGEPVTFWNPPLSGPGAPGVHMYQSGVVHPTPGGWGYDHGVDMTPDLYMRGIIEVGAAEPLVWMRVPTTQVVVGSSVTITIASTDSRAYGGVIGLIFLELTDPTAGTFSTMAILPAAGQDANAWDLADYGYPGWWQFEAVSFNPDSPVVPGDHFQIDYTALDDHSEVTVNLLDFGEHLIGSITFQNTPLPSCLPPSHPHYDEWVSLGKPDCWCYASQCYGDVDGEMEGSAKNGYYRVHFNDLNLLLAAWNASEPPHGPGIATIRGRNGELGICADFDHTIEGNSKSGYYRVHFWDLNQLLASWNVKEQPLGPGLPRDCGGQLEPPIVSSEMVLVNAGTFNMGDALNDRGSVELPVHAVSLDSFHVSKHEVTTQQYCDYLNSAMAHGLISVGENGIVCAANPATGYPYCDTTSSHSSSGIAWDGTTFSVVSGRATHPMVLVSWYGSAAYCNWRSVREGLEPCYDLSTGFCDFTKKGYRLPTEAEWEYSARGGLAGKRFSWGDTISHSQANYNSRVDDSYDVSPTRGFHPTWNDGTEPYTSVVGSFAANGYGLYDMVGNVWEWCNDWYGEAFYAASPSENPTGPMAGIHRVLRGGSWRSSAMNSRSAGRHKTDSLARLDNYGFRVVMDLDGKPNTVLPVIPSDVVAVAGGQFVMGDVFAEGAADERPVHHVQLPSFYIGRCTVTNERYVTYLNSALTQGLIEVSNGTVYQAGSSQQFPYCDTSLANSGSPIGYTGSNFTVRMKSARSMANDPAVCVSWFGAVAYCNWRSQQEGFELCYDLGSWNCDFSRKGYRLPTEAEWEYAARGGLTGQRFAWGDTISHSQANYFSRSIYAYDISPTRGYHPTWYDGVYPFTSPVDAFASNGYGLHDMTGNVWQWCNDWYDSSYYTSGPPNSPTGPAAGTSRVRRGGCWGSYGGWECRLARRGSDPPTLGGWGCGFRVVLCTSAQNTVIVPDLIGASQADAEAAVVAASLVVGTVSQEFSDTVPEGHIISQIPSAGQFVPPLSLVSLVVSEGPQFAADGMVLIPGGTFEMGDSFSEGEADELPVHAVTVSPFYMAKYEITNQQYCDFLNSALGQGLITVTDGVVYKAGSGTSYPYCGTWTTEVYEPHRSQIIYSEGSFSVRTKDGRSMVNDPMVSVSWYGAVAYCNWRSQQLGRQLCYDSETLEPIYPLRDGVRLATEAEWEYAARGGFSSKRFPWGDTINHSEANYNSTSSYPYNTSPTRGYHPLWWNDGSSLCTSPVGFFDGTLKYKSAYNWPGSATSYQTTNGGNGYGLYDMAGNVWEWCNDWWLDSYYSSSPSINPTGPSSGSRRVLRGGNWLHGATICRAAHRGNGLPRGHGRNYGFRLVLDF